MGTKAHLVFPEGGRNMMSRLKELLNKTANRVRRGPWPAFPVEEEGRGGRPAHPGPRPVTSPSPTFSLLGGEDKGEGEAEGVV